MATTTTTTITRVCNGLRRWYEYCGCPEDYDSQFSKHCEENGFDLEAVDEELLIEDVEENQLLDFIEDFDEFPFPNIEDIPWEDEEEEIRDEAKVKEFILNLMRRLSKQPNMRFDDTIPIINEKLIEGITADDVMKTRDFYKKQLPFLWNRGMSTDCSIIQLLAIGRRHRFDFLQHLVDDYARCRKQRMRDYGPLNSLTVTNWVDPLYHQHFHQFKDLEVTVWSNSINSDPKKKKKKDKGNKVKYPDLVKHAVSSYMSRVTAKLMFTPLTKINSSLETTVKYMAGATTFILNMLKNTGGGKAVGLCPFQLDVAIATGKPQRVTTEIESDQDNDDDDDDDDDDENDEYKNAEDDNNRNNGEYWDFVGDIKSKLSANDLKYAMRQRTTDCDAMRVINELFYQFCAENKIKNIGDHKRSYLQQKRLCVMVDRREYASLKKVSLEETGTDDVWMYEPPKIARDIPSDALSEWYFQSSRLSILPDFKFGDGEQYIDPNELPPPPRNPEHAKKFRNIEAGFSCKGGMLTLSFHVRQEKVIKLYLFYNGQCIRFMPEDVRSLLPILFNLKYGNNEKWIERKEVDDYIEVLKRGLVDEEFSAFRQTYTL